jgi:Antibiotic biosynthesis monooxygenase
VCTLGRAGAVGYLLGWSSLLGASKPGLKRSIESWSWDWRASNVPAWSRDACLLHSMHRDAENELRVVFVEQWLDAESLEAHFHVPAAGEFVREATSMASRPPEMAIFEAEITSVQNLTRKTPRI